MMRDPTLKEKYDLERQVEEHTRKIMHAAHRMINSETPWQRDQFYLESMRHMGMMQEQLGVWRLKSAKASEANQTTVNTVV